MPAVCKLGVPQLGGRAVLALDDAAAADASRAASGESEDVAYMRKNQELEAQLGDVERKLRLDRLYATRPPKQKPRVYF